MGQFFRFLLLQTLALSMALALAFPASSLARDESIPPLVTIRFNQPQVYYEKQLYGAIAKALALKQDVLFDVVSFAPETGNTEIDKKWQATAGRNTRAVIKTMNEIGVPMERISVTGRFQQGLRHDETQVFVY